MRIGVPTEIKNHEYRVGLTPNGARELVAHGHEVFVQDGAGNRRRLLQRRICRGGRGNPGRRSRRCLKPAS
jgi:alanine dehydrogenase